MLPCICAGSEDISKHGIAMVSSSHRIGIPAEPFASFPEFFEIQVTEINPSQLLPVSQERIWHLKRSRPFFSQFHFYLFCLREDIIILLGIPSFVILYDVQPFRIYFSFCVLYGHQGDSFHCWMLRGSCFSLSFIVLPVLSINMQVLYFVMHCKNFPKRYA